MDLKTALNQKKAAKASITRLKTKTEGDVDKLNLAELEVRHNRFTEMRGEIKDIFSSIINECAEKDFDLYCNEKDDTLDVLEQMLVLIQTNIHKCSKVRSTNSQLKSTESADVKLPTLSLPLFSGVIDEWLTFSDLFRAAVSDNTNLTNAQKLQYLKGVLRGDAQKIVQSLPITDGNFKIAWDLLTERYFNKREILSSVVKKFMNLTSINGESHAQMLSLIDSTKEFIRTLEYLEYKVDPTTNVIIMFFVLFKLDSNTRTWFERTLTADRVPELEDLLQFISTHARSIMTGNQNSKRNFPKKVTLVASKMQSQCPLCHKDHALNRCETFLKLSLTKRMEFVKGNNVCFNCLTQFHGIKTCKSRFRCQSCKKPHHTLLHFETASANNRQSNGNLSNSGGLSINAPVFLPASAAGTSVSNETSEIPTLTDVTSCFSNIGSGVEILLCTALIRVRDFWGNFQTCRCLLDSGSQASLITSKCIERLGLRKQKADVRISCLGASDTRTSGISQIQFTPHFPSQCSLTASVYVVNKIVGLLPHHDLDSSYSEILKDLTLADPTFHKSSPVDILLGVDVTLSLLRGQTLSMGENKPIAIRSDLGWVIGGKATSESHTVLHVNNIQVVSDQLVNKFWELDSVPCVKPLTPLESSCEEHFKQTHSRSADGRYTVRLPFLSSPTRLGQSKPIALRRFISMERHLSRDLNKYDQYRQFINEYLKLNHMESVPKAEYSKRDSYYLPHHAVLRDSSSTTKLRVVFDGSSKTSSDHSLNDILMVGPRVQPELFPILIQFRTFRVAVCADVEKMFRQIRMHPDDADWQRILWRNSPEEDIAEYRLITVTYGTACAPFLSTRTLQQLALDEKENYPRASRATLRHFYVDDLLSGAATREEAIQLVNELLAMFKKGGFPLRKWHSNDTSIFREHSADPQENDLIHFQDDDDYKVLGINWVPKSDVFNFTVVPVEIKTMYTKREILSQIARVFDPLGLLSPCVIFMKVLLQELWQGKFTWDQPLPSELCRRWRSFLEELHLIEQVTFPRYVLQPESEIEIHAFCDASETAYCATIYVRCISISSIRVILLTSKTRVAPLKVQSLPRLELCSALLLTNLLNSTVPHLDLPIKSKFAWSDSKIALAWINSEPRRWQPFVANRVAQIQELSSDVQWNFVSGLENPADCGTRGLTPSKFVNCDLWFNGPKWLSDSSLPSTCVKVEEIPPEEILKEEKKTLKIAVGQTVNEPFQLDIFHKFSSWNKLKRVLAWCLRFINNSRTAINRVKDSLTTEELNNAEKTIVKHVQKVHFRSEFLCLSDGKQLSSSNRILSLTPFVDDSGLLRVGGRLQNARLPEDQKHPLLLPKSDHVVDLIINHYHLTLMHAGPELLQAAMREKYWVLSARDAVRRVVRKCIPCFRNHPKVAEQIMGNLPESRVCPSTVFQQTGLDFAGPFLIRSSKGRGSRNTKCYICVFVCLTTKAVHFEVVSDLSTKAFIACLKRFVARRGKPAEICCDRGTNFYGASRELSKEFRELINNDTVKNFLSTDNIIWRLNPPSAPHFGGLWESAVKSFKYHLKRVIGNTSLTFEELATVASQIEACLNSRPLCGISSNPNDLSALTPGHFLIGKPLTAVPQLPVPENIGHVDRWRMLQRMMQHFWCRWSSEYLTTLQSRVKWRKSQANLNIGDLVLIKNENFPPLQWKLGRIMRTFPGKDKKVRVAEIKTQTGELIRPISKLCPLPTEHSNT